VLQLCECLFETITLPILFYQFTMLRFSVFMLHASLGFLFVDIELNNAFITP